MIIYPAIDLLDGKCVRLYQGDYSTSEQVANDPYETVIRFINEGAKNLHVVDLNAASGDSSINFEIIKRLCEYPIKVNTGGGIRNIERVEACFAAGVDKIIVGTAAVANRPFLTRILKDYPNRVIVGVDVRDSSVKTSGWTEDSGLHYIDFIEDLTMLGVQYISYTDISKDGTLSGINPENISTILKATTCNLIVGGGVKDIDDIKALKKLDVYGVICGKSIYSGTLSLEEAVDLVRN